MRTPRLAWVAALGVTLAACGGTTSAPTPSSPTGSPAPTSIPGSPAAVANPYVDCSSYGQVTCITPAAIRAAYDITPVLSAGITGAGQTVVLREIAQTALDPPDVSDIQQDIAAFDSQYGFPALTLNVETQLDPTADPTLADSEEVQDVELVHTVAPGAAVDVVLQPSTAYATAAQAITGFESALNLGASEGNIISFSVSYGEQCFTSTELQSLDSTLATVSAHGVTVTGSSGDYGAVAKPCPGEDNTTKEVGIPAADPHVLAVGGTHLVVNSTTGAYVSEVVWNTGVDASADENSDASGGGFSTAFGVPAYQKGVPGITSGRGVPDVAADAALATGMAGVVTLGPGDNAIFATSGTSAGAPLWAGVVALADQLAHRGLGSINASIYSIAKADPSAFQDVTQGSNTVSFPPAVITGYSAGAGWDPVTGWGSPNTRILVPLLAAG